MKSWAVTFIVKIPRRTEQVKTFRVEGVNLTKGWDEVVQMASALLTDHEAQYVTHVAAAVARPIERTNLRIRRTG